MRIAVDFSGSTGGGALTYLKNFSTALASVDQRNEYFLIAESKWRHKLSNISENFCFVEMPCRSKNTVRRLAWQQLISPLLLKQLRIDIVFSTTNIVPLLSLCPIVLLFRIPPSVLVSNPSDLKCKLRWMIMKASLRRAISVISVSELAKREIIQFFGIPACKIHVVYHGTSDKFRGEVSHGKTDIPLQHPFILSISLLYPHKNYPTLIKAFSIMKKRYKCPHKLVIIGDCPNRGYLSEMKNLVREFHLEGDIIFISSISHSETIKWYRFAEAYILPSFYETFGLTIIEAMACGVPVLTSNTSAMPEIGGEAALYFNPNNPQDIANRTWEVLSNKELREKMVRLGTERACKFTWEDTAKKTLKVIEKAWGQRYG